MAYGICCKRLYHLHYHMTYNEQQQNSHILIGYKTETTEQQQDASRDARAVEGQQGRGAILRLLLLGVTLSGSPFGRPRHRDPLCVL